jgi:hypothetical protein
MLPREGDRPRHHQDAQPWQQPPPAVHDHPYQLPGLLDCVPSSEIRILAKGGVVSGSEFHHAAIFLSS